MRRITAGWWILGLWIVLAAHLAGAATPTRILLVSTPPDHPPETHLYQVECEMLAEQLNQLEGVQATAIAGWPPANRELLEDVGAIVFYSRPAGEMVLHPQHRESFEQLMKRRVGFVAIHWATGIGYSPLADAPELREAYKNVLGGWFRRPPGDIRVDRARLQRAVEQHPIYRGWEPFELRDEFYLDLEFHPQIQPLLRVQVAGRDQIVAWAFERPDSRGRSFGTTLGHFHANFTRPEFRRLLLNGILWTTQTTSPPN